MRVMIGLALVSACKQEDSVDLAAETRRKADPARVPVTKPGPSTQPVVLARLTSQLATWAGGPGPLDILGEMVEAVIVPPLFQQTITFRVPRSGATLAFRYATLGLTVNKANQEGCVRGARFQISVGRAGGSEPPRVVFKDSLIDMGRWVSQSVDLKRWSDEEITASFRMSYFNKPRPTCKGIKGAWGEVRLVGQADPAKARARLPNIWIVVVDTLRNDALGHVGGPMAASTPRIDALARTSYRFSNAWSAAPWTLVSVISMLTGEYYEIGSEKFVGINRFTWPKGYLSIAKLLQKAGYRTIAMIANPWMEIQGGVIHGFDAYHTIYKDGDKRITELVPGYLDNRRANQPKFFYLHLISPHLPFCKHKGISERYLKEAGVKGEVARCEEISRDVRSWTDRQRQLILPLYKGEVEYVDQVVGRILDTISKEDKHAENWVFFTSDHGEELLDHGGFEHGHTLYEELLHVPLIIRPPNSGKAQMAPRVIGDPVSLVDIAHTVAEVAGLAPLNTRGGRSLVGVMKGAKLPLGRTRLASGMLYGPPRNAIRSGGQKRIWTEAQKDKKKKASYEEFDLLKDPRELKPLKRQREGEGHISDSELGMVRHLVSSGKAILHVQVGARRGKRFKLKLNFEGELELLAGTSKHSGFRVTRTQTQGARLWELTGSSDSAGQAFVQLKGINERMGLLTARIEHNGAAVAHGRVSWPHGTEFKGNSARIPTPWDNFSVCTVKQIPPTADTITVSWHWPTESSLTTPHANRPLIKSLKSLGYIQ